MKKTYGDELFKSSAMFVESAEAQGLAGAEVEPNDSQVSSDEKTVSSIEKPIQVNSADTLKEPLSDLGCKETKTDQDINIIKKIQDDLFKESEQLDRSHEELIGEKRIFNFEKIQGSSKTFSFNKSSDIVWKKSLEEPNQKAKKILVIGDTSCESSILNEELKGDSFGLLAKMFGALELVSSEVHFCSFIEEGVSTYLNSKNLYDFLLKSDINLIITLGAAPLKFFQLKGRLTKLHGTKAIISFDDKTVELLPIFHPEYLLVNPNMKKRVWQDIKFLINS
mgnify:CR=1 FL=1|jgi:hypothetical protein